MPKKSVSTYNYAITRTIRQLFETNLFCCINLTDLLDFLDILEQKIKSCERYLQ